MAKPPKSQWDFGELFPPQTLAPARRILSVAEFTSNIRRLLEKEIGRAWVAGEITNLKQQSSGHIYFTLKDAAAQLNCVLFRGESQVNRALLQDGRKVALFGELTVYEPRGVYQLRVMEVELQGIGALQVAFEKLKEKLNAEGLFAQERKRPLPRYPQRIGLVTSPTGAAIRDVLHVVRRRNPGLEIFFVPCRVQGTGAAAEIAAAIRLLNEFSGTGPQKPRTGKSNGARLDLVLLTRGGGSLEDLWAFNEEMVARAIFNSQLPVVSAVGHEIDFTISDFVADLRAATPSAGAEMITEGVFSSCQFVAQAGERLTALVRKQTGSKATALQHITNRLARHHPRRVLNERWQRLDDLHGSLLRIAKGAVRTHQAAWRNLTERLLRVRPALLLRQRREVFHLADQRLREQMRHRLNELSNRLNVSASRLRLLGPEQVLARGYSITMDAETGKVLRAETETKPGRKIRTRLKEGEITSTIVPPTANG